MNFTEYAEYITYISPITLSIGVIIGWYYFKNLDNINRLLLLYLAGNLVIDLYSRIIGNVDNNNLILFFVIGLFDIIVFTYFYINTSKKKKFVFVIGSIATAFILFELIQINLFDIDSFQMYSNVAVSLSIISMSILLLIETLVLKQEVLKHLRFLNIVCMFYFAYQLILLLPINFLITETFAKVMLIWILRVLVLFIFYFILIYLIWKNGKIQN